MKPTKLLAGRQAGRARGRVWDSLVDLTNNKVRQEKAPTIAPWAALGGVAVVVAVVRT
jgi:hypothetical protein